MSRNLHSDLRTFSCCWRHYIAIKVLYSSEVVSGCLDSTGSKILCECTLSSLPLKMLAHISSRMSDHPCTALFSFLAQQKKGNRIFTRLCMQQWRHVTWCDADNDHRRRQRPWSTVNLAFPFFSVYLLTSTYKTIKPYERGPGSEGWVMRKLQNGTKEHECLMYTGIIQFEIAIILLYLRQTPVHDWVPRAVHGYRVCDRVILSFHGNEMHQEKSSWTRPWISAWTWRKLVTWRARLWYTIVNELRRDMVWTIMSLSVAQIILIWRAGVSDTIRGWTEEANEKFQS